MSSMEHHGTEPTGYIRSFPPEYALIAFAVVALGVLLISLWPRS